jgi:formiminoglutamate deiminase
VSPGPVASQVIEADWTWTGGRFAPGVQVRVGEDGRIAETGPLGLSPDMRLERRALLPGMVTAHSHAFQRGLRGRGETFPEGSGSFWTWRQAMYDLVEDLDPDAFEGLCRRAFREMRAAGITCVGEFHYLHHRWTADGGGDYALDERVLRAAAAAGIRIALLQVYYRTGGIDQPLEGAQLRFGTPSPAVYWEQMARLREAVERTDPRRQSLGASVHSIRAAGPEELAAVYDEARRRDLPFHIHVEEQRREIEEALAFYGKHPMTVLLDALGTATDVTAVHCTHTSAEDMERFLAGGGTVCLCPLTEANLGDGIAALPRIHQLGGAAGALCLGSDSNARISMLEEMRWLEYAQRLATESRGVLRDGEGSVGRVLFRAATEGGAQALGIDAGRIEPGCWADLFTLDLDAPTLAGWTPETLLDALVFGAGEEAIDATCVAGEWGEAG